MSNQNADDNSGGMPPEFDLNSALDELFENLDSDRKVQRILSRIHVERQRQHELPGSEWDARNTPGDWVALIGHYVNSEVRRNGMAPDASEFEDSLIKAAAVILAAIGHLDDMKNRGQLL